MKVIKGFSNYAVTYDGKVYGFRSQRFLKQSDNGEGYLRVSIQGDDGKWYTKLIHRLVAETFIPNPEGKDQVNHKDGNRYNNDGSNLEWVTCLENVRHSREHCLRDDKATRFLTDEQAYTFFKMIVSGCRKKDVCDMFGLTASQFRFFAYGQTYAEIREECCWEDRPFKRDTLSIETVIAICDKLQAGKTPVEIEKEMGVPKKKICSIKRRKSFRTISESYTF